MGATNQTTNYELPLFIGTDKPSWLGDFNGAMNKIDTSIKGNKDEIDSLKNRMTATETVANTASSSASTALTNANTAQTTANTAQSTANTADTKAEGAQSTANTALSNASTAQNTADTANATAQSALTTANLANSNIDKLNLTNFDTIPSSNISSNYGTVGGTLYCATNTDGSVGKLYGYLQTTNSGNPNNLVITITGTNFRPSEEITIVGSALRTLYVNNYDLNQFGVTSITIQTNGTITINVPNANDVVRQRFDFIACLLFLKQFNDSPIDD